jgi:hypothetical protein
LRGAASEMILEPSNLVRSKLEFDAEMLWFGRHGKKPPIMDTALKSVRTLDRKSSFRIFDR